MYEDEQLDFDYFDPKKLSPTLEPGDGSFIITQVIPKESKAGNKMLELTFKVKDINGKELNIIDWLVATPGKEAGMKTLATKIRNLALCINKPTLYAENAKKISPNDLLGEKGRCLIKTYSSDDDRYPDKSIIAKFYPHEKPAEEIVTEINDAIPF